MSTILLLLRCTLALSQLQLFCKQYCTIIKFLLHSNIQIHFCSTDIFSVTILSMFVRVSVSSQEKHVKSLYNGYFQGTFPLIEPILSSIPACYCTHVLPVDLFSVPPANFIRTHSVQPSKI